MTDTRKQAQTFKVVDDHGRKGYEAFAAVHFDRLSGVESVLASPVIDDLADMWGRVTEKPLDRSRVQKVIIVKAE
jgi:hypothetical protein